MARYRALAPCLAWLTHWDVQTRHNFAVFAVTLRVRARLQWAETEKTMDETKKSHSTTFVNLLIRALDDKDLRKNLAENVGKAVEGIDLGGKLTEQEVDQLGKIFEAVAPGRVEAETYACPYRGYA